MPLVSHQRSPFDFQDTIDPVLVASYCHGPQEKEYRTYLTEAKKVHEVLFPNTTKDYAQSLNFLCTSSMEYRMAFLQDLRHQIDVPYMYERALVRFEANPNPQELLDSMSLINAANIRFRMDASCSKDASVKAGEEMLSQTYKDKLKSLSIKLLGGSVADVFSACYQENVKDILNKKVREHLQSTRETIDNLPKPNWANLHGMQRIARSNGLLSPSEEDELYQKSEWSKRRLEVLDKALESLGASTR